MLNNSVLTLALIRGSDAYGLDARCSDNGSLALL